MTERRRILFVDDDASLLAGLRNVLHRDRKRWDMVFVLGGQAALDELGRARFDAVVSDMRMPDVDGEMLLAAVKEMAPTTLRVMLSGSDRVSQQDLDELLVKPCSAANLRAALERLFNR